MKKHLSLLLALCMSAAAMAQNETDQPFNGMVSDITGTPLRGVRVYVLDKNYVAKSDRKGRFGLTNVKPTDTLHLVYRKVQYDIPVAGRKSLRVRLGDQISPDAVEDQELVDIGYGFVSRREQLTSSSGISGEVLRRTGETHLLPALRGLVPGLNIQASGQPGGDATVTIRGVKSLMLSNEPLYIVDGVVVSSLDFINIYDVESVEVMKDASIYGSRGANGAILVHTRKANTKK
ncbi:MAG: TonB-dependent receptor plug domain-containing protein [Bacteroidales bacterium]|nr:TonB-dependent receptor plug domain-containing protein [Bacteroidales bacterium]